MRKYILSIVAILAIVAVHAAFAGPVPNPGITQARAPLARSGSTVLLDPSGTVNVSRVIATFGTFGNLTVTGTCTGCGSGGGGSGGSGGTTMVANTSQWIAGATGNDCAKHFSLTNPVGLLSDSSHACEAITSSLSTSASTSVFVDWHVDLTPSANSHELCWLALDASEGTSGRVSYHFFVGGNGGGVDGMAQVTPSTAGSHTYSVWCAGDNVNNPDVFLDTISNANNFAPSGNTGSWIRLSTGSGSGGSGGGGTISDPITVNGWTPASGTATVTGAQHVTGAITAASSSISGSETVSGSSTISGSLTGNIVVSAGGAFETPSGFSMELIPPAGRSVRVETSGTQPTCDGNAAGGLWYESGAGSGNTHLEVCLCGRFVIPACAWTVAASH